MTITDTDRLDFLQDNNAEIVVGVTLSKGIQYAVRGSFSQIKTIDTISVASTIREAIDAAIRAMEGKDA